jgi:hypothetical protein
MKITSARNAAPAPTIKVAITGPSGSGKTSWLCRAPNPLMLMFERQGIASVRAISPDTPIVELQGYNDFRDVWQQIAKAPKHQTVPGAVALEMDGQQIPVSTICIDSMTDLANQMFRTFMESKYPGFDATDVETGKFAVTQDDYGKIGRSLVTILDWIRDSHLSVAASFLPSTREDLAKNIIVQPAMVGQMAASVALGKFNAAGYSRRRLNKQTGELEHVIVWTHPSERYPVKGMRGWPSFTVNTLTPGQTTLGSLMLATYGDDANVVTAPGDSASWCTAPDNEVEDAYTASMPADAGNAVTASHAAPAAAAPAATRPVAPAAAASEGRRRRS